MYKNKRGPSIRPYETGVTGVGPDASPSQSTRVLYVGIYSTPNSITSAIFSYLDSFVNVVYHHQC